jgi:hypothetical protein
MLNIAMAEPTCGAHIYQVKISLKYSKPLIWRRVLVRADMRLDRFHTVIQKAMGWYNSHLHQFTAGGCYYGTPDPEMPETMSERRYSVADLAPTVKCKFAYEYDFGDSWLHEIEVEQVLPPDADFKHPQCLAGANACPPEDCGAMPGYYELVAALANPKHPEHKRLKTWVGGSWDAALFDLAKTNAALKRIKA